MSAPLRGENASDWIASPFGFAMTMPPSLRAERGNPGRTPLDWIASSLCTSQ
ncbi:MAG: hypothetical protein LBT00_14155 [Spirochaetaceae bacterium]|nr:hypothetical protein [Spirochaetaceae bacterium]